MALVTLQTIFQDAFPAYEQRHALPAHVRRAAHAIMQCRTAALGGHVQACPDGHFTRIWYNSCRHRSCPQCAYLQTERWLALQQARLLACDHYHVIFTLPHDLNPLWLANVPVMSTLLFQAARDTLCALLADPKYLGAQPGIIAALHTWSQTLLLHPTCGAAQSFGSNSSFTNGGTITLGGAAAEAISFAANGTIGTFTNAGTVTLSSNSTGITASPRLTSVIWASPSGLCLTASTDWSSAAVV